MRRGLALLVVLVAVLAGAASAATPPPATAALGDSITRGFNAGLVPFRDAPSYSWATGTHVSSAAQRLQSRAMFNDAKDGARMRDLPAQAARAAAQGADHVLILMGANDICHGDVAAMTSTARFRSDFESALRVFATRLPDARIEVLSIPDLYRLWQIESGRLPRPDGVALPASVRRAAHARAVDGAGGPRAPVARAQPAGGLQPDPRRGLRGIRPMRLRRRSRVQDEIRASATSRPATSSTPRSPGSRSSRTSRGARTSGHPQPGDEEPGRPVDVRESEKELGTARMPEGRPLGRRAARARGRRRRRRPRSRRR